ncbi:MAG TPA: Fe-S cluster assembly protein SufD [Gammaproteobacteria bacterium]|nr:Fe-S cluster assembly protein SufD [Gammaproteobacteria bacterium]
MSAEQDERIQPWLDAWSAAKPQLPGAGADWLRQMRERALSRFAEAGFPGARDEDWKYTSVRPIAKRGFRPAQGPGRVAPEQLEAVLPAGLDADRLVFVNGHFSGELSGVSPAGGVHADSLARVLAERPGELEPYLARCADLEFSSFVALNTAFVQDGAFVRLERGAAASRPLHLVFLSTREDSQVVASPRVVVAAGENSELELIEHHAGLDESANFTNAITELHLADGARLRYHKVQQESAKGFHVASVHAWQGRDSRLVTHNVDLGGTLVRNDLRVRLAGAGAEAVLNGLYVLGGRQHVDNHTRIDHEHPQTSSDEHYKGIVGGRGRAVFNGKVVVHPGASQCVASQYNGNLLLSGRAEVDTKPELEIYNDDVQCSHGASVGQLDEQALFYLRARGLDQEAAQTLLTWGFASEVVKRVRLEVLQRHLEKLLMTRLPESEVLKELV